MLDLIIEILQYGNNFCYFSKVAMDNLSNIRALLFNVNEDLTVVSIKTNIIRNESNGATCVTNNLFIVYVGLGGDLSKDHDHIGLSACLTGNLAVEVLGKSGVEHGIRDLVAELVEVTLVYKFSGE